MFILDFLDSLDVVILIIVFIMLYKLFYPGVVESKVIALAIAAIVTYLLVIPYDWFRYFLFVALFLYSFFWSFQPWDWGKNWSTDDPHRGP